MPYFQNTPPSITRRRVLGLAAWPAGSALLGACGTPLPLAVNAQPRASAAAAQRLAASADAHGLAAYREITDINIGYAGQWRPLINRVQPEVVDEGFRGPSQERLMPAAGVVAQAYRGAKGSKQVFWQRGKTLAPAGRDQGEVAVWFNGQPSQRASELAAAALVAEGYGLFLLGPLWVASRQAAGIAVPAEVAGTERVHGRLCDVVNVWLNPGLGHAATDRTSLLIDRDDHVMRRVRFTLEGYEGTRGAVAEVDCFEHARRFGLLLPMRSYEEVVHPIRLPAHDWFVTGLDVNRGYGVEALRGAQFSGAAAAPAKALAAA
jgi:hypothetical protein